MEGERVGFGVDEELITLETKLDDARLLSYVFLCLLCFGNEPNPYESLCDLVESHLDGVAISRWNGVAGIQHDDFLVVLLLNDGVGVLVDCVILDVFVGLVDIEDEIFNFRLRKSRLDGCLVLI